MQTSRLNREGAPENGGEARPGGGAVTAFIALGSNLGDRAAHLTRAVELLDGLPGTRVERVSPVYETEAHTLRPDERQPAYLNGVVETTTTLAPPALLEGCLEIERQAGRRRGGEGRWQPRPLDLDLLLYGDASLHTARLVVPHPRMAARRFVLQPLADLAADRVVPDPFGVPVRELLERCPDRTMLRPIPLHLYPPSTTPRDAPGRSRDDRP